MATVLVFDIETIPDVAGLRRLDDLPASLSDTEVAEKAMADRLAKTGSEFLPLTYKKSSLSLALSDARPKKAYRK